MTEKPAFHEFAQGTTQLANASRELMEFSMRYASQPQYRDLCVHVAMLMMTAARNQLLSAYPAMRPDASEKQQEP